MKYLPALLMFVSPLAMAAPSMEGIITALIWLVILGCIFWLAWWFIGFVGLPEPFNKVAHVLIGLAAFVLMMYFLLGLLPPLGHGLR